MEAPPHDAGVGSRTTSADKNKMQRIGTQTRGLFEDFKSWIELRLKLFQLEVQEKVQHKVDAVLVKLAPVVVGALGGLFALVTAALFIGWALGHPAWGFLIVTSLLFVVAGMLYARSRRFGQESKEIEVTGSSTQQTEERRGDSE